MLFGAVYLTHAMIQDVRSLDKGDITRSALQHADIGRLAVSSYGHRQMISRSKRPSRPGLFGGGSSKARPPPQQRRVLQKAARK